MVGDELIVPLNVELGGQASPQDTHMEESPALPPGRPSENSKSAEPEIRIKARSTKEEDEKTAEVLKKFFERQKKSVLPKMGAKAASWWDKKRWDKELADDLEPELDEISDFHGESTAKLLGYGYNADRTRKYIRTLAEARAEIINESTYSKLKDAEEPGALSTSVLWLTLLLSAGHWP